MADQAEVAKLETQDAKERLSANFFTDVKNWIRKDFKSEFRDLISRTSSVDRNIGLANLGKNLSIVLQLCVRDQNLLVSGLEIGKRSKELEEILFGDSDISVIGKGNRREFAKANLIGPISVLTFLDLISGSDTEVMKGLKVSEIATEGVIDNTSKVDLILRFGDKNPYADNAEIVRLVQLKTSPDNKFIPKRVSSDSLTESSDSKVTQKDIEQMEILAQQMEGEARSGGKNIDVQIFTVTVPAYDARAIGNVFGIISTSDRTDRIGMFQRNAAREGLLPSGK